MGRYAARLAALLAVLLLGIYYGGHPLSLPRPLRNLLVSKEVRSLQEGLDTIEHDYYRKVSRNQLVDTSLAGAVRSLHDPFSSYFDPAAYRRFQESSHGRFSGVGLDVLEDPRGLRVVRVFDKTPAQRAGIRAGDRVVAVNGHSLRGRPASFATALIRGRPGTSVTLTIARDGRRIVKRIERAQVSIPVVSSRLLRTRGARFGYVELASFSEGAHGDVSQAVRRMLRRGARGIVFDLRGNGGGLLDEAVLVASVFVERGTIVSTDGRARARHVYRALGHAVAPRIPVVVLVDGHTASASEIVAGALQDHHRAKIVGRRTFGKGVFQSIEELPNGGALDITVGEYFTPNGHNLGGGGVRRGGGIKPDVRASDKPRTRSDEALAVAVRTLAAQTR